MPKLMIDKEHLIEHMGSKWINAPYFRACIESEEVTTITHCAECRYCGKSDTPGCFYCSIWDAHLSMDKRDPERHFCSEGAPHEA